MRFALRKVRFIDTVWKALVELFGSFDLYFLCLRLGGGHVDLIEKQVVEHLKETLSKKNKGGAVVRTPQIKNHLSIMVNCLVANPGFDSQTKDYLTTKPMKKDCKVSEKFLKSIDRS